MEGMNGAEAGLAQRVMKEILDTPALKEVILLHMRGVRPRRAEGLAGTLLWEDPAVSMSFLGTLPDAAGWLLTLLAELGEQLESIPPPLLLEILGKIASGVDREKMKRAAASWGRVIKGLAGAKEAGEGGGRQAARCLNAAIARLDGATLALERDPEGAARALADLAGQLDTAALRRSLRRLATVAFRAGKSGRVGARRTHSSRCACCGEGQAAATVEGWRRFMYAWNTVLCLTMGPVLMLRPSLLRRFLRWPGDDPVMTGIYGSIVTSVGVLSAAALADEGKRDRFVPVFHAQLLYKTMTCLMLRRELRRRETGRFGLRVFFWFFVLYIAMLAAAVRRVPDAAGGDDGTVRGAAG